MTKRELSDFKPRAMGMVKFIVNGVKYELNFQRYELSDKIEKIKVIGKTKTLYIKCDRPEIRISGRKRVVSWKLEPPIDPGIYKHAQFFAVLTLELEMALEKIDFNKDVEGITKAIYHHRDRRIQE